MKTVKIDLQEPVMVSGVKVSTLTIRAPKVRDQIAAASVDSRKDLQEVFLFSSLCAVEPAAIEEMDLADYVKLQEAFASFFS